MQYISECKSISVKQAEKPEKKSKYKFGVMIEI